MRLLLDTNVLVAAYATEGACMRLYRHCARRHTLVTSEVLIAELEGKLLRKLKIAAADVASIIETLRAECVMVSPDPLPRATSRDPDDDWVIATAAAGACQCIVTGDRDLLVLGAHEGVRMIQPSSFWDFEARAPDN